MKLGKNVTLWIFLKILNDWKRRLKHRDDQYDAGLAAEYEEMYV